MNEMPESYDIALAWSTALSGSPDIAAYCQNLFGKRAHVTLGAPYTDTLNEKDAPYIIVLPAKDEGGFEAQLAVSTVAVVLGIHCQETQPIDQGEDLEILGYRLLRGFEQTVVSVLAQTEFAPSTWEGETSRPGRALFERAVFYEIEQHRTI